MIIYEKVDFIISKVKQVCSLYFVLKFTLLSNFLLNIFLFHADYIDCVCSEFAYGLVNRHPSIPICIDICSYYSCMSSLYFLANMCIGKMHIYIVASINT